MSTCNRLDLETLDLNRLCSKISPDTAGVDKEPKTRAEGVCILLFLLFGEPYFPILLA